MFHTLYRKKEDELPKNTPLQSQKKRQIEDLKTKYENVSEVAKDIDYRIPINPGNVSLMLIILLPPHFPQDGPQIHVSPSVLHPWVNNQQQITGCHGLKNFTMHSDLGDVIQEILVEFQKRPPVLDNLARCDEMHYDPLNLYRHNPLAVIGQPHITIPTFSESGMMEILVDPAYHFPELTELSQTKLELLQDDDDKLNEFIDTIPAMKCLEKQLNNLRQQNEEMALKNLERQPEVESLKEAICVKADESLAVRHNFEEQNSRFQHLAEEYSPAVLCKKLKAASLVMEEESDKCALNFLQGDIEVDAFLTKFLDRRTLYHIRRVKEEKLQNQLLQMQRISH